MTQYDFLLKGGRVIDPANGIDAPMDVAVATDKIAAVAPDIPAAQATQIVDAAALIVHPGLTDIHAPGIIGCSGLLTRRTRPGPPSTAPWKRRPSAANP